jgi:hypothetical protein
MAASIPVKSPLLFAKKC